MPHCIKTFLKTNLSRGLISAEQEKKKNKKKEKKQIHMS